MSRASETEAGAPVEQGAATGTQPQGVWLMVASSVLVCCGQLLWKLGATRGLDWIGAGLVLYALGAVLMLVAYRFGELSVLQPVLGLSYALSLILGALWLGEAVTMGRVVGVLAVTSGVAVLATGSRGRGAS